MPTLSRSIESAKQNVKVRRTNDGTNYTYSKEKKRSGSVDGTIDHGATTKGKSSKITYFPNIAILITKPVPTLQGETQKLFILNVSTN